MARRRRKSRVRFTIRKSSRTTVIAVCAAVAIATVTLLVIHAVRNKYEADAQAQREKIQQQLRENEELREKLKNVGTLEGIRDFAEDVLGWVDKDTVIFES